MLLREQVTNDTVSAWFSGAAARGYLDISKEDDGDVVMAPGPRMSEADAAAQKALRAMFGGKRSITLGKYSKSFAKTWASIRRQQQHEIARSGYWKQPLGSVSGGVGVLGTAGAVALMVVGLFGFRAPRRALGLVEHPAGAIALAAVVTAIVALMVYRSLLPARTAEGSALAVRTESFRRFLGASEGQHVEWAWKHGLLREYSAWAVALGAASTWQRAMEQSSVPPAELVSGPMIVYTSGESFSRSHTAPSSSGSSSSGGGFSGGSVGGGGGGGSSGSW